MTLTLLVGASEMDLSSTLVRKLAEPIGALDPIRKPPVRPILQYCFQLINRIRIKETRELANVHECSSHVCE